MSFLEIFLLALVKIVKITGKCCMKMVNIFAANKWMAWDSCMVYCIWKYISNYLWPQISANVSINLSILKVIVFLVIILSRKSIVTWNLQLSSYYIQCSFWKLHSQLLLTEHFCWDLLIYPNNVREIIIVHTRVLFVGSYFSFKIAINLI